MASDDKRRLLDIGALHGTFSLAFTARPNTIALAIDPSLTAIDTLRENCRLNPGHDIRIFNAAVGATEGKVAMRAVDILLQAVGQDDADAHDIHQVPMLTVDTIVADQRFRPDIVKIDVEGYEREVLLGMSRTIQCFRPVQTAAFAPHSKCERWFGGLCRPAPRDKCGVTAQPALPPR